MHAFDAITLLCFLGIAALVACLAYAFRDIENREEPESIQRDPRPDMLVRKHLDISDDSHR